MGNKQGQVKTDDDIDFAIRVHIIMNRLQFKYDVSQFPVYEVIAAKILLKDVK